MNTLPIYVHNMYLINACDYISMQETDRNRDKEDREREREKYFNRGAY